MLSIENPPPDPPCPCEISQLKSCSDERASDKVALQEVDLLKSDSGLDNNNPLPKFSIRDYVFGSRSKDIKSSWPFSQKNLQLCLKHGVKDLLPPFQPLDSVRNRVFERCEVETSLIGKENISNSDGEPSGPSDHFVSMSSDNAGCNEELAVDCVNICLIGSEEADKENNQTHSKIDSVPADCAAAKLEETDPSSASQKTESESTSQPPVKKCRLILKVGSAADPPSSNQDTSANCVAIQDTMASNVCPVCKAFSSPSNTTLNAHIDQCLSVESTVKWTANSRVIKHRIKPRKTKLMVDIYATAPHCTLEELDRRNGRSWAMNSSCLPTRETVERAQEEKQSVSPVNSKEKGDERAVYIDANGTKLRILSMFSDASSVPKLEADPGPRKPFKGSGRRSKLLSTTYKKKMHLPQKHQKYLKLAPQSKKICSSKPRRSSEVRGESGDQKRNIALEESCRKQESPTRPFKAQEQIKINDSGTITKWACSKRTGLLKRRNRKEGLQHLRCNFRPELPVESESPLSSPESSKRMENYSYEAPINECNEQPVVRKRVGFISFGSQRSQISGNMERFLELPGRDGKQLRKDSTSGGGSCKDFASNGENYVPYFGKEPVEVNAGPSRSNRAFSSKSTKLSSLRKRMLSVHQSSVPESKYKVNRKCSFRKKFGVRCVEKIDKRVVEKNVENQSKIEEITGKVVSLGRCSVLKIRKKRRAFSISQDEESMALKSASECHGHEVCNNIDSSARDGDDLADISDDIKSGGKGRNNIVIGPSSEVDIGGNVMSLSKSLVPDFHKLVSPSNTLTGSLQSVVFKRSFCGAETPSCPTDPSLADEQEIFCVDEVGNGMIAQNTDMGAEMGYKDGQGNYFSEVDPIPIPGPPGSFLPSPRDMGSEDLQGNSSLTTSLVQTSEDHHDLVDRDSSDSPISAVSTISNSMISRSNSKSSEILSVGPHVTQDEIRSGFFGGSHNAVAENTAPVPQAGTIIQAERANPDELKVNMIVPEKGPISFRNDQPCCCSRKEGMSRGVSLNYQESQLLRRRTMASLPIPAMGKQLNCDPNRISNSFNSPSSGSEKVVLPVSKSAVGPVSAKVSADSTLKSPFYGDCDSASPSASNPILRLMGKNLMVVNKDENVSQQFRPAQSGSPNDHPNPQFRTLSGVSPGNIQNEDFRSFHHHMVHQYPPLISGQNQFNTGFEVELSNNFGGHVTHWTPQISSHASPGTFLSKNVGGGFAASLEPPEYKVRYSLPNDQNRSRDKPYTPLVYNLEKVATTSDVQLRNADSTTNPAKEIIIIDDTPEKEAGSATDAPPYSEGMKERRVSSAGISIPMTANYNSRHMNPFYSYQPQDSSPYSGATSASPIKWNCTSEGSSVMPPSSIMASTSSSSTGRLKSSLYYSPSFS